MKRKTWTVDCIWQKMVSTQHSTCYRKMFQFYKSRFKDCSLYIYMHSLLYHSYMCTLLYNCISVSHVLNSCLIIDRVASYILDTCNSVLHFGVGSPECSDHIFFRHYKWKRKKMLALRNSQQTQKI